MIKCEVVDSSATEGGSVARLPGKQEAEAIASDMMIAKQGVMAWISAGLRLADVKNRLPRGEFMKWVNSNFQQLEIWKPSHLFAAMRVAKNLLKIHELKPSDALEVCETANHPLWLSVAGRSSRQLTLAVQEEKKLTEEEALKEAEAKEACELIWETDAKKRDKWEPQVIRGDQTYCEAFDKMEESNVYLYL